MMVRGEILVIDGEQIQDMMEKAAMQAAKENVEIALVYTDKSVIYDDGGDLQERRDIDIKILARPSK
jgi:hypothetical protein